jgi:hypothetical protein
MLALCLAGVAALCLSGCPGGPERIDVSANYPELGVAKPVRDQRSGLVVFTATFLDVNHVDDAGTLVRHTGYTLYSDRGEWIEYVRNFIGSADTEPTTIDLEPGRYLVRLDNPEKKAPIFWVVIKTGMMTTVDLLK